MTAKRLVWETNRDLGQRLVYAYRPNGPRNARNTAAFVAPYLHWVATRGNRDPKIPLDADGLLAADLVEAYLDASDWSDASKAGARSVLRRIDKNLRPYAAPLKLSHQRVSAPYTADECAVFVRLAWHQPSAVMQRRMGFIVGLGLGAGLDAQDMRHLQRRHLSEVTIDGRVVLVVTVPGVGARARTVPVRERYVPLVKRAMDAHDAAGLKKKAPLVARAATTVNMVSTTLSTAKTATHGETFQIRVARLRHTWLVSTMCAPISLVDVMQAAGIRSARTLTELLEYCPPASFEDVAAVLAACTDQATRPQGPA